MLFSGKIKSIWNDLNSAAAEDTIYRIWDMVKKKTGLQMRIFPSGWMSDHEVLYAFGNHFSTKDDLCNHLRERISPHFFFSWDDRESYFNILHDRFAGEKEILLNNASRILEHHFDLLGREMRFSKQINWHISDDINRSWPLKHWSKLNIGDNSGYGDIKPTWELNRHQYFLTLGRAYWWTGRNNYVDEFSNQLNSWIKTNPAEMGINWQSNLEIALRTISWIWALNYFIRALDNETLFNAIRSIVHSGLHLNRHINYSWYCMHNNHLVGDAAGLAFIAQYLPELTEATLWKRKALNILYKELSKQVYDDGVNFEQAINYHRFVYYLFLLVVRMEQLNGGHIPTGIIERLEQMAEYLSWMIKPDGSVPMIGDSDDAAVVILGNEELSDFRPVLATGAVLYNRGDFKFSAQKLTQETLWLCGPQLLSKWDGLVAVPPQERSKAFSKGGYYVMRTGWGNGDDLVVFRNGPHSDYHAHADQLHIELSVSGRDILVDPGTYVYNNDQKWRSYFRGTYAHNTVVVDGESQAVPYRAFRWLHVGKHQQVVACYGEKIQWVLGGHTGYKRYPDPVIHQRGLLNILGHYIIIRDNFIAKEAHSYETLFHLGEGESVLQENDTFYFNKDGAGMMIRPLINVDGSSSGLLQGETNPKIQGWISPGYGECRPAPVLRFQNNVVGPWSCGYLLWPISQKSDEVPKIKKWLNDNLTWVLESGEYTDYVSVQPGITTEEIKSDCQALFYRLKSGHPELLFAAGGGYLSAKGVLSIKGEWSFIEIALDYHAQKAEIRGEFKGPISIQSEFLNDLIATDQKLHVNGGRGSWTVNL